MILAAVVIGVYPSYPAVGPLENKSPREQAQYLKSIGMNMAGGIFKDRAIPEALREAGIRTFGLVVLFQGEEHWKSHPESRPIMADGQPLFKDRWYAGVCPNQDWLRKQKLAEIEGMLRSGWYDVINLDFIRYPVHWEVPNPRIPDTCYCAVCLRKFRADTGVGKPADDPPRWRRWRAEQITKFCEDVKKLRDRIRPATLISLAAVPWQRKDYDNAIYNIVAQDFRSLARVIDIFQPMSYHALNNRPVEWIGEVNTDLARETGKPIWPFVIFSDEHPLKDADWRAVFNQALANGASGLIAFPFPKVSTSSGFGPFRAFVSGRLQAQ